MTSGPSISELRDSRTPICQTLSIDKVLSFGVRADLVTHSDIGPIIDFATGRPAGSRPIVWGNHNLHSLYLYYSVPEMAQFYEIADLVHIDGTPVAWHARLSGFTVSHENRISGYTLMPPLLAHSNAHKLRVFLLGGEPGVAEKAAKIFQQSAPDATFSTWDGYFDKAPGSAGCEEVLKAIADFRPHVLLVGMGMPIQEKWITENLDRIQADVIIPQGAFMDYYVGVKKPAPLWLGRLGLEWLFRLATEPKRLARRYGVEPWLLMYHYKKSRRGVR
jgi:N-acetylglucosaminyldiphosphoundecaprenol N-acetyl-beta-D-mannosaminyltransferase